MRIGIVGTGYVGLVTGACFASVGNEVYCVDTNTETIAKLQQGIVPIYEPQLEGIVRTTYSDGLLHFTTDITEIVSHVDCIFICVGTPTGVDGACNTKYVEIVAQSIGEHLAKDMLVIVKSTVPVGTTKKVAKIIEQACIRRSVQYVVDCVFNPEFLKEGHAVEDFKKPDRIIIGTDTTTVCSFFEELYLPFNRNKSRLMFMSIPSAEMTKYASNAMLATKISFINEIARICEKTGADIAEVRNGMGADIRIGYHFIYPGVGYGGSCFPKDIRALMYTAKEHGVPTPILEAVETVNTYQKQKLIVLLEEIYPSLAGKVIAIWGIAFKPNTDDIREAPSCAVIQALLQRGAQVRCYDPVAIQRGKEHFIDTAGIVWASSQQESVQGADVLCILTEWSEFANPDFAYLAATLKDKLILDGRNMYIPEKVRSYGLQYRAIGRPTQ